MHTRHSGQWRQLYAIGLLTFALLAVDGYAHVSNSVHMAMTVAIAIICFALAFIWVETNADLMEQDGVDRQAGHDQARRLYVDGAVIPTLYPTSHPISLDSEPVPTVPLATSRRRIGIGSSLRLPSVVYWMVEPMRARINRTNR